MKEGRQALGRASSTKQTVPFQKKLASTDRSFHSSQVASRHNLLNSPCQKAQEIGLKFIKLAVLLVFIPRVVGHERTILYDRSSGVASLAPAIQADFRASVDGLLDPYQQVKQEWIPSGVVLLPITDTVDDMDLVKAPEMGLKFYQTYSYAGVHILRRRPSRWGRKNRRTRTTDTVRRPGQKSHRTHWQPKQISVHRSTDCLTKINNRKGQISLGFVLISFCNVQTKPC